MQDQKTNKGLMISLIIVVIFIGAVVYTLTSSRTKVENESQLTKLNQNIMEQNTNTDQNRVAQKGDVLLVKYTGKLENGTVFDSNVDPKFGHVELFQFVVGGGNVIEGWDTGFIGMKEGETKTIVVPPEKGYGAQAVGIIPPNSTLIFDVELVTIK